MLFVALLGLSNYNHIDKFWLTLGQDHLIGQQFMRDDFLEVVKSFFVWLNKYDL